jgi:hypothetical protein
MLLLISPTKTLDFTPEKKPVLPAGSMPRMDAQIDAVGAALKNQSMSSLKKVTHFFFVCYVSSPGMVL